MPIGKIPKTYHGMRRLKQIMAVFVRHGFYDMVSRINLPGISKMERDYPGQPEGENLSSAQRLRMAFEELGPTFIKLGQMLSLEPDIIPADFVAEFQKLQDKVTPFAFGEAKEIIETELGEKTEDIFSVLEPEPMAAASVSQVHLGNLPSGRKIVVKVQRPNIERLIREDIYILKRIARTMEKRISNMELLDPVAIVDEFENFITKEIDFTNEAASIERFINNFKDDPTVCIPEVYWEMTTSKVLVMEYLEGWEMDEVEKIRAAGLDLDKVAQAGLQVFAKQILVHGFFHADPHPGNALITPQGQVGLIDFGITGFLDKVLMGHLSNIFIGYSDHDYERVISAFMDMGLINERTDIRSFRYDLMGLSEPFYGRSLEHIRIKDIFDKTIDLAVKHRIRLPRDLILLFKTLIAMESVGRKLSPQANILEAMKPFAIRFLENRRDPRTFLSTLRSDLLNHSDMLRNSPELFYKILKNIAAGTQRVEFTHQIPRMEEMERSFVFSLNRLTVGMVTGTSVLAGAWMLGSGHQYLHISIPFLGIESVPLTIILGLISYSVATVLGIWLVLNIFFTKITLKKGRKNLSLSH